MEDKNQNEETTTIRVHKNTAKDVMLFKIQTDAKNVDAVIKEAITQLKKLKKEEAKKK